MQRPPILLAKLSSCDVDPNVGRVLDQKYRLGPKLGQGGMGVVYRGVQLSTNRPVAVKLMCPGPGNDRLLCEQRLRREAEATAALSEQHTVRLFDVGVTQQGEPFLVMELLRGKDLGEQLQEAGPLSPSVALRLARQVVKGLAEVHALGITHRDLKPSNVFLARRHDGTICVKLLDFGIARFHAVGGGSKRLTNTGGVVGTPAYMAPEQFSGATVDARSDLYSFGALLFEMLTGYPPFGHEPIPFVYQAHLTAPVPQWYEQSTAPRCARALQELLDRLLAKHPADRFPDCQSVLRALDTVQRLLPEPSSSRSGAARRASAGHRQPDLVVCGTPAKGSVPSARLWQRARRPPWLSRRLTPAVASTLKLVALVVLATLILQLAWALIRGTFPM